MKNIVFVGKFFPEVSYETLNNYLILRELKLSGNYIILISDSWNRCCENNFIWDSKEDYSQSCFVDEYYYLDPVQMNYNDNNINVALIALYKKVLKYHKIDMIITSNIIDYGLVLDYIKKKFSVNTSLIADDRWILRFIEDDYTGEIAADIINCFDKIIISEPYYGYLRMAPTVDKSRIFMKDVQNCLISNQKSDFTLIFGIVDNFNFFNYLIEYIENSKQEILIVIYGVNIDECKLKIIKDKNVNVKRPRSITELIRLLMCAKQIIDCHYFVTYQTLEDYNGVLRKYNKSVVMNNDNNGFHFDDFKGEVD